MIDFVIRGKRKVSVHRLIERYNELCYCPLILQLRVCAVTNPLNGILTTT